jgi:diacylglycerol kinase (ATP)
VTLIHNPSAGDERHSRESLVAILVEAGHEVAYASSKEQGWKDMLRADTDLVVAAGGDGTVRKVFKELAGLGTPVTLFPVGSANNIARTLGFEHDDAAWLVRGWEKAARRPYDLGRLESSSGQERFVESIGAGIFAEVLARAKRRDDDVDGDEKVELGLRLLRGVVEEAPARRFEVVLDGVDVSADLLAIEAMNVRETGPNVPLAPNADPGDGLLDLVVIGEADREELVAYLDARLEERSQDAPRLDVRRGQRLSLRPPEDCPLRVDDEVLAEDARREGIEAASATADASRLFVLVPALR